MNTLLPALLLCAACASPATDTAPRPFRVEVEAGALWPSRNDVRIPGDSGTRFDMTDLTGSGPAAVGRVTADWDLDEHHALRAVIAPLELEGTGELSQSTAFDGETFAPGTPTRGLYRFHNYRLGYRYTFHHDERWRLRWGGTLFVRDAKVELEQGATRASDSNVGLVPLLNFAADYHAGPRWRLGAELDGLLAPQGRAFDLALKAHYALTDRAELGFGYRTIEGGADNDEVYSFAWFHAFVVSLRVGF